MGRPPSTGGPAFRFNSAEVAEMESILQAHNAAMPSREVLDALAQKFSVTEERSGKFVVQMKQVWHWFQNRRYALRAKAAKYPAGLNVSMPRDDPVTPITQAPQQPQAPQPPQPPQPLQPIPASPVTVRNVVQAPQRLLSPSVQVAGRNIPDNSSLEFEAKSARDGAWYDVATFLSHRKLESGDSEVLVRFAGFGPEEDEWVNVKKLVRQRSLPCESSECVAVIQGDLILCFQEGKEQALYFDAHVLDAQRRRHDIRGCRCRFLVRYDHDLSEEIVPLRKICRRPETDYRLQQLYALNESATNLPKAGPDMRTVSSVRVYPPAEKRQHKLEGHTDNTNILLAASHTNVPAVTQAKVQQPKVKEIPSTALGNSNVHTSNVIIKPKVETVDAGDQGLSNVSPGNVVQLPRVANTTSTLGNSDVSHGPVGQRQEGRDIVNDSADMLPSLAAKQQDANNGSSSVSPMNITQQQEATDMISADTLANSDAPPANVKQQPNVPDIVSDVTLCNSDTPPPNVTQQPNVTNTVSVDTLGNADVPPDNVTQQPNTDMVSDNTLGSSDLTPPADMQQNVSDMVSNDTVGVSDLPLANVTQPLDVTDMLIDDTVGVSDLPPANATQPVDITDMLIDDTVGNPDVPPADVVQQPEATPGLDTNAVIPENSTVPSDNGV